MELKFSQKIAGRNFFIFLLPFVMIWAGDLRTQPAPLNQNGQGGGLDIEFLPDYKSLIPGYREKTVDMVEGSSEEDSDAAAEESAESDVSFFTKIFSDRTFLNILLVGLGFVILIIYRLRSGKVRR